MVINKTVPPDWFYDPRSINYLFGGLMQKEKTKRLITEIIKIGGREALQLSDKPNLEQAFVNWSSE